MCSSPDNIKYETWPNLIAFIECSEIKSIQYYPLIMHGSEQIDERVLILEKYFTTQCSSFEEAALMQKVRKGTADYKAALNVFKKIDSEMKTKLNCLGYIIISGEKKLLPQDHNINMIIIREKLRTELGNLCMSKSSRQTGKDKQEEGGYSVEKRQLRAKQISGEMKKLAMQLQELLNL